MNRKKLMGFLLAAAVGVTALAPTTAMAETTWQSPTSAMQVDDNIAKVGIHAAASTTSFFLGGNVVAERASDYASITNAATAEDKYQAAMAFTRLGAFGSSSNISPDPYLWNYFYNIALDAGHAQGTASSDAVYISAGAGSPMSSDTAIIDSLGTSYTLDRRPEILMDRAGGYAELIKQLPENTDDDPNNDYDPISISYYANNFADLMDDMYNLSDAMKVSGKSGRYGDTDAIAQKYEAYMKGLQYYVIKQIAAGNVEKKNVAVITDGVDTNDDGKNDSYICVSNTITIGTSTDRPSESVMYTSNNILNVLDGQLGTTEVTTTSRGQTTTTTQTIATAEQVASMDAIILGGHNTKKAAELTQELVAAGVNEDDVPPIYDTDPSDVFTIRANSVENFVGVGIFNGWLYPEILNPVDATMYVYENFWHLDESQLQTFAQANFAQASLPEGITTDGSTYDESKIESMIEEGLAYGKHAAAEYEGTTLELSDHLTNYANITESGHVWDAGVQTKIATVSTPGEITYTCLADGETRTETPTNQWIQKDGVWYYIGANGCLQTGWVKSGNTWYYMNKSGAMATGWIQDGGKWYFMNKSGAMATGWIQDGGKWYYMNKSGAMATGWIQDGGKWYFMNKSGSMATGWIQDGGKWYYMSKSGSMATGWIQDGGKWYYLSNSGAMAKGWQKVGSTWYYMENSGAMAANKWVGNYYVTSSGAMATNQWIGKYYVGADGKWIPNYR